MNPSDFSTIFFPSFGIEINPPRGFEIFGTDIRFYGVIAAIGMIISALYGLKRCKEFGLDDNTILDGILIILPFALFCARLYYCIFSWEKYADNPMSIFNIKQGGLAFYGGVIGGIVGIVAFCKIKKISIKALLDITLLSVMVGHSLSRWGNFFNREAFGAETDSFLRMGLYSTVTNEYMYFHPTFLYESMWNLIGFFILHHLSKKRQYDGQIALGYATWYGFGRMLIEGLRMDSLYWGPFRVSQLLSAIGFLAATTILIAMAFRKHNTNELFVNKVARMQKEAEQKQKAASKTKKKKKKK